MTITREMIIATIAPDVERRAACMEHAIRLVRTGVPRREANRMLRDSHSINRVTAWKYLTMARDLTEE